MGAEKAGSGKDFFPGVQMRGGQERRDLVARLTTHVGSYWQSGTTMIPMEDKDAAVNYAALGSSAESVPVWAGGAGRFAM